MAGLSVQHSPYSIHLRERVVHMRLAHTVLRFESQLLDSTAHVHSWQSWRSRLANVSSTADIAEQFMPPTLVTQLLW